MSSPTRSFTFVGRRSGRRLIGAGVALVLTGTTSLVGLPAHADPAISPRSGNFTIRGTGFGHGWGMSQYGAYGAAREGKSWRQILGFYYPGTTIGTLRRGTTIKVWITADADRDLRVLPSAGLALTDARGTRFVLPREARVKAWRVTRSGSGYRLTWQGSSRAWTTKQTTLGAGPWWFSADAKMIKVRMPSGSVREYRGTMALVPRYGIPRTVNRLTMEDYLKSVVPSEMPTSWAPDAVRAQAVAARSYAARVQANAGAGASYHICDTVDCQVYAGYASIYRGRRYLNETAGGNAAVKATAGKVVRYGSGIAFTQFSSSNGGHSATGSQPYLRARPDPYDGVIKSQAWTTTMSAERIRRVWPSVGTVEKLQVISRDGAGTWGGRVRAIKIIGSKKSITVTGNSFRYIFGLRSNLFTVTGPTSPTAPPPSVKPGRAYATFPRSYHSASRADLLLLTASGSLRRHPVVAGQLRRPTTIATGLPDYPQVINAGDWNGDGYQDVIVRTSDNRLKLLRGTKTGRLAAGTDMGIRADLRSVTSVGDVNRDRYPDLVAITSIGNVRIYYGDGRGVRKRSKKLASGWGNRSAVRGTGDFTGDRRPDFISQIGDGLYLSRGTANGGFTASKLIGRGWRSMAAIVSIGDFDGDRKADLVARTSGGKLRLYRGTGTGRLLPGRTLAGSYAGTRFAT